MPHSADQALEPSCFVKRIRPSGVDMDPNKRHTDLGKTSLGLAATLVAAILSDCVSKSRELSYEKLPDACF